MIENDEDIPGIIENDEEPEPKLDFPLYCEKCKTRIMDGNFIICWSCWQEELL